MSIFPNTRLNTGSTWLSMVLLAATLVLPRVSHAQGSATEPVGAIQAYRDSLAAFERGDADAYFGAFAERLYCFYGALGTPRARVSADRRALVAQNRAHPGRLRLASEELGVAQRSADRVVLRDRGTHGRRGRERQYDKMILMARTDGRWRVAGEGGRASRCYGELMRSEVVTGVDPLATEDGVWAALLRTADLSRRGRGILWIGAARPTPTSRCQTDMFARSSDAQRASLTCDVAIERCVLDHLVYRFAQAEGHRQLVAVVAYARDTVPPAREAPRVVAAMRRRDRSCELHDRLYRADRRLVSSDVWQLSAGYTAYIPAMHLCGDEARESSRQTLSFFSGGSFFGLVCGELSCRLDADATGHPHVRARREAGRLRIAVDGRSWLLGDNISRRDEARMREERCPAELSGAAPAPRRGGGPRD